jgi:type IV pilus assembly protein PilW
MKTPKFVAAARSIQKGLTLVELLVALALSTIVTMAVLALYTTTANTYRTNDASQEMQDNARFIMDIFSQQIKQSGLQDQTQSAQWSVKNEGVKASYQWNTTTWGLPVFGFSNSTIATPSNIGSDGATNSGGLNFSDVLGFRYFGSSSLDQILKPDGAVVDCQGVPQNYPLNDNDIGFSLFWVMAAGTADGEPELQCISRGDPTAAALTRNTKTIARGVESLQVIYGIDTGSDSSPNRWLDAQQVTAAGAWSTVRMVRIGFILRGPPGSGIAAQPTMYPLGDDFSKVSGASSTVNGMFFTPPDDKRMRKSYTLQVTLRNS